MPKKVKNPALTSPWKIGVLVALLLFITNAGVAYYLINQYNIDLEWLTGGKLWGVDSYLFFKEMYPLVAGMLLCSLFSYFTIASAVRRYKYYVDSGQDYRKMISLASSIDDLTNPAQIARLSEYPKLQEILRNYGDQIREISEEISSREEDLSPNGLEAQIELMLKGEQVMESVEEDVWWAGIVRKLDENFKEKDEIIEELYKMNDADRRKKGNMTLSMGRLIEYTSEAKNSLASIRSFLNEVTSAVASGNAPQTASGNAGSPSVEIREALSSIESSLRSLEEGGSAIRDFSEKTNGLALNIALLAARGEISEKELAGFAEKARMTSEKFIKLGKAVSNLTGNLKSNFQIVNSWASSSSGATAGTGPAVNTEAVSRMAGEMEGNAGRLEAALNNIEKDLSYFNDYLRSSDDASEEDSIEDAVGAADDEDAFIEKTSDSAGEGLQPENENMFVINHGKAWEDYNSTDKPGPGRDVADTPAATAHMEEEAIDGAGFDESEPSSAATADEPSVPDGPIEDKNLENEAQDESWTTLNVNESPDEVKAEDIEVEFKNERVPESEDAAVPGDVEAMGQDEKPGSTISLETQRSDQDDDEPHNIPEDVEIAYSSAHNQDPSMEEKRSNESAAGVEKAEDDDPIVDLFELGAVELDTAETSM